MSLHKPSKKPRSSDPALLARRNKYYSRKWKKLREQVLKGNPLCSICQRVKADTVDHITHERGDPRFYDITNLRPACRACNSSMGRRQALGMGRGGVSQTPPMGGNCYGKQGLPNPLPPRNERFAKGGNDPLASILSKFINKAKEKE